MLRKNYKCVLATASVLMAVSGSAQAGDTVRSGTGADTAGLQAIVDAFRGDLGTPVNTGAGVFPNGRREINWDAVGAGANSPNAFPGDFFNQTGPAARARGASFTTPGTGFQVSGANATPGFLFGSIDPSYTSQFTTFSADKLFTPIGSNIMDVRFSVPGSPLTSATVTGFGAVFTDVDDEDTTSLEFFDVNDQSLGQFFAETQDKGLSFLGVSFDTEQVARVRITTGNTPLGAGVVDGQGGNDVVAMDDFIYAEPKLIVAAPEPTTIALLLVGGMGICRRRRQSQK